MFEAQVLGLLQRYLGKYVYGLDVESLRISVWRGDVELSNLRLKPEALDEFNLPVTVKSGLLGRLRLKVPWSQLGTQPVVAEFDRLYIVASPREDDSSSGTCPQDVADAIAAAQATEQAAKQHRIDTAEDTWLKDVAAQGSSAATDGGRGGGSVGRFRALVDTIIGNLELKISNIHIRYEDSSSNPGHTFCIGVLLSEISAHTVGEDWQRKFVTADALLTLRKGVQLKSLAVYFDCDKPLMDPGHRWDLITASRWDELMLPANQISRTQQQQQQQQVAAPAAAWVPGAPGKPPEQQQPPQPQHQFLLCPVDGTLRYVRRGRAARKSESDAEQEIHLQLVQIGVQLHQLQYQSSQKLLQEFDRYAASAPHRHLRPHCRPNSAAGARLWWRYAITVVQRQQQTYSSRAWKQLRMLAYYQRYVTAYLKYLQQGKQGSGDPTVDELDSQLDEAVILLFRRMAHARLKELRAKASAADVKQPAQQQTWVGWLLGTGAKPAEQQAAPADAAAGGELDTSMGVEEWNKLEDVLAQQAAALSEDANESPFRVRSVLRVQVSVAAVELQGAGGTLLMQASMGGVDTRTVLYPQTQDIALSVATFGVTSCHGPFISSGLITTSGKQAGAAAGGQASALSARVLRNPQDNSADLVLRVAIAPSYVTYSSAAVQDVVGFFKSDDSLELSRLQAQAAARTDKLRHMAQLQLQALSQRSAQQKPRMQLLMTLHAPKIAIPDGSGGLTLIADLGCFTISTNTAAAGSLSAEEAALYECFVVRVDHVSAYLLDGQFAWPSNDELLEAAGGRLPAAASSGAVLAPPVAAGVAAGHPVSAAARAGAEQAGDSALQQLLGRRARIVPLLYRFGLGMDLQVATSVHPRYPVVRLAIAASPLQLHLSPYRYQQLMTVLQSALASPEGAAATEAASSNTGAAGDKPLWLSEAEYTAKVSMLTWEGLTSSVAKWQSHRYAHVWRGRLYITAHKEDTETVLTKTYWMAYRVVQLQPSVVGGCDNVVAVVPKGAKLDTVTESTDAVILRATDAAAALELRKRLSASANQMSAVAGLLDLDESAEVDASIGTTKDVFEELLSHQLLLQMYGSISEVSLLIAGRAPVSWWPPNQLPNRSSTSGAAGSSSTAAHGPQSPTHAAAAGQQRGGASAIAAAAMEALAASTQGSHPAAAGTGASPGADPESSSSSSSSRLLVPLEEEVDLVAIKFQGAQVGLTVSGDGFSTEVAMAALTIDDLLVGSRNPDKAHMARSSIVWEQQTQTPQQQPLGSSQQQQQQQGILTAAGAPPHAAAGAVGAGGGPAAAQPLVVDTGQEEDVGIAFHTITDEGEAPEGDDDEFYDADEGDASTPRSLRSRSGSGAGSAAGGEPFAHSISLGSTTSLPTPFEGAGHTLSHPVNSGSGGRQHWSQGAGSMAGLRDLLPSMQDELSAGLTSLGSDGEAVMQAPSFQEASKSFGAARDSTRQQQQQQETDGQQQQEAAAGGAAEEGSSGQQELVRLLFAKYNPTSTNYTGLDMDVVLRLSTLVFYCNRPTVAALMMFGTDLGAVNTLLAAPADEAQHQSPGLDAAGDSATTESESVSDVQLLRSGGDERTLFRLTLQVTKVELLLNYEGAVQHPLAIGSIDNFLLELAVHPATLQLHTSLGNMVMEYGTLPKTNPNRTMLSVRDKQAGSLIDVVFKMHSLEQSFAEARVPGGVQYMSVVTHLSTVQIIFMNRFLVEFLDYLAAMLAMQAPPKLLTGEATPAAASDAPYQQQPAQPSVAQAAAAPADAAAAASGAPAAAAVAPASAAAAPPAAAAAAAKPVVVLLDVVLEAPVLLMPLSSGSDDLMEVDLGTLQLQNLVVWEMASEDKDRQKLLVDQMQITLQKVSGCVVADGVRGRNIIREMGGGVSVCVRRPLLADPLPLPPITTAVTVPKLRASLLDTEYALILAILAGNFAEAAQLPPEIVWLQSSLLGNGPAAAPPPPPAAAGEKGGKGQAASSSSSAPAVAAAAAAVDDEETSEMKRQVVSDFSCTSASLLGLLCDVVTTKVTVSINQAQLMLWNAQPQGLPPAAVGSVELKNLWVAVSMTQQGNMLLWLSLPSVCARDLRPGVPKEASLVLSTAEIGASTDLGDPLSGTGAMTLPVSCPRDRDSSSGGGGASCSKQGADAAPLPSLLTLQYRAVNSIGPEPAAALQVRLQRPTLVLDVGFILKVLHFVAPQAGLQGPVPRPYATNEVHLGPEPYCAPDHLWLSPEYRIIADAPGLREAVYDGQGHALVLPAAVPSIEHVPLIVVGRGVSLRLRNVKIINHASLAGVLSLAPGARLVAEQADGVSWHGAEEALRLRNKSGRHILIQASRAEAADAAPAAPVGSMTIAVHAVGAAVYLIDAHTAAEGGSGQDTAGVAEAVPGTSIPTGSTADAAGAAGSAASSTDEAAAGAAQAGLLRMLALYLDCGLDMEMKGPKSKIVAQLLGLSVKAQTRLLEDVPAASTAAAAGAPAQSGTSQQQQQSEQPAQSGHTHHQQQQQVATSILEPCDVRVTLKADDAVQDMNVDVSALQLRMSPDVMQLLLHLQQVVMEPLAVPPAIQPLARVDKFVYMWSSHGAAEGCGVGPPYATAGAGGVDVIGSDKGVTVWRPQPPMGYALLGDVLAAGHSQPDHQVVAVAINSGLVTYPLGFVRVWESPGISFWRPVAPTGYVPMGCIASAGQPDRKTCVVVARQAVVPALLSECLMLCTNGNLWCIQNSMGTFEVAAPDTHHPKVPLYDLRSPLGVAPAALTANKQQPLPGGADAHAGPSHHLLLKAVGALTDTQLPPSLIAAKAFGTNRAALRAKVASSGQVSSTVEFTRLWWDKHSKHPSMTQVSMWRPVPPPGYVSLGDCMVTGMYCPPSSALVLRDTDPSELVDGRPPLLARPISCVVVWTDGHKKARGDPNFLTLWKPVAPAGYVTMGLLAGTGGKEPNMAQVRCVRADLATRVEFQLNSPALIFYPYKQRPALAGWVADERAATFVVQSHDGSPQPLEGYRLKEPDQIRREKLEREGLADEHEGSTRALQMSLSVGKTNLLLRNLLRTPILELEASKLNLGLSQEVCGVRRCFAYLTTSLWSYNQNLEVWEPIMEPWQLLLHMDTNPNPQGSAGIRPGSWVRLTSPHGCVHITLAQAALNSCLDALTDWQAGSAAAADVFDGQQQQQQSTGKSGLAAADGLHVFTTFTNTLDTAAYLQLNYGEGRKQVVMLPPHAATPLTQPLPVPPTSHAPLTASQAPPVRLVIDILDGQLVSELAGTGSTPELSVKVEVTGRLAKQLAAHTQGMATRAVPVQVSFDPSAQASQSAQQGLVIKPSQHIAWNERFVLALPADLAEQLLMPAPGDNPFEGVALSLKVTVLDGSGDRGLGRVLSSTEVPVTFDWLLSQVQALLAVRADAAAAVGATTAAAGASAPQQEQQVHAAGQEAASTGVTQAADKAGEKAGQRVASKAAKAYGIGLQETLQLWRPGKGPHAASPGGPEQPAADAVAAATAAAAAAGQAEGEEGSGGPIMQLQMKLSLDDSQVSSSWYPHQLMRRRLAHLLAMSRASGSSGAQLQLSPPGRQGSRHLSTDSRLPQTQQHPLAGAWGMTPGSSGSRNALRLEGSDVWSPFSYTSLRRLVGAPAGAPHSGVVPIRAGPGLVLEMAYIGGQYQGRIRSLCQFYNATDLVLEVALLQDEDTSWTLLPTSASSSSSRPGGPGNVGDVVEEEVFEYERYLPLRGWSASHLSALDPRQFSRYRNGSNGTSSFPRVPLAPGWEWEGQWEVERHPQLDPDGWEYAFDVNQFRWPPAAGAGIKKAHDFVRRRRWVRKRRRVALPSSVLDVAPAGNQVTEQVPRRVLGQVQPGGSLPLPQDWKSDNKQLQIRPLLQHQQQQQRGRSPSPTSTTAAAAAAEEAPSHAWSYGVSSGQQSVLLPSLEDGASRLLCCPTLGTQRAPDEASAASAAAVGATGSVISPRSAAAAAPACWFTAVAEASELLLHGAVDALTDWRITAQPPLTLRNDLPVAAHYVLWERPARGGSLVLRQQGRLEGWSSINVYSVDMRQQVCLTFHPEGAEWVDPEPVIISEGFLGSTAGVESTARQVPSSFCVSYTNSQASRGLKLRLNLQKHIDTELLMSQRLRAAAAKAAAAGASSAAAAAAVLKESPPEAWRMSYGAALAQGRPLTLSVSVPVWVVNGTQLPIAVGIVPITTAAGSAADVPGTGDAAGGAAGSSSSQDLGVSSGQGVGQLRVLDTEAYSSVTRPSEQVMIMGNSIELLSYPADPNAPADSSTRSQQLTAELAGGGSGVVTQWAAVFSVMGSRWSSPVVLSAVSPATAAGVAGDAPVADAVARMPRYDPVLIRARCRDGSVYEVTVRLESAGTGLPMATFVRLDPHMLVSNRTGYTLHMLQPEPIMKALGGAQGSASWLLSSGSGRVGNQGAWIASAPSGAPAGSSSSSGSGSSRPPQAGSASATAAQEATLVLRPGALAVPLSWPAGASRRLLALTLPPSSIGGSAGGSGAAGAVAAAAAAELSQRQQLNPSMWSEPFRVAYPATGVMQVLLPLFQLGTAGEPRQVDADSRAAALAVFRQLFQPAPHQQGKGGSSSGTGSEAGRPPKPPSSSKGAGSTQLGEAAAGVHDNTPMLVHVAKQTDAGLLEYLAVTVNVSVEMPTPGCLHLVLQSLGGEPQQCLMNCTAAAVSFRQATPRSAWQLLPPYSATALVLLQPPDVLSGLAGGAADPLQLPSCSEVMLRDSDPATSGCAVCTFDTDSSGMPVSQAAKQRSGSGNGSAGGSQRGGVVSSTEGPAIFPVHGGDKQALAQVLPLLEAVMGPAGPAEVPGAGSVAIGRTQLDRLLRVIPKPASVSINQLRLAASIAGQDQSQLSPSSSLHVALEVPALDVSLVDGRPQELVLLSMDGLVAEYHAGNSAGTAYTQVLLRLNLAQLDDMQHGSAFPVVLLPADKTVAEDSAADPLLFFTRVTQPSRYRGVIYTPTIVGHIAALRLQLSETLVWRLYSFTQGLATGRSSSSDTSSSASSSAAAAAAAAAGQSGRPAASSSRGRLVQAGSTGNLTGAGGGGGGGGAAGNGSAAGDVQQVASADLPLQVDLVALDQVPLTVSFKTERAVRPRWANQMWVFNTFGDMLDLDALQLALPGVEFEGIKAPRSALITYAIKRLQAQALAIAFNVFRSYGVLGTATKLLAVGSNITSTITGTSSSALGVAGSSSAGERVGNVGQGIVRGTMTFGGGLLKGVTGIVADPVAGAKQGGVLGFMTGVGKGLVGVPGQIIGGALSAASQVTEGLDASVNKMKEQITGTEAPVARRRRLPRCIRGDRILTPFAVGPALGLALLHNSGVGPLLSLVKGAGTPLSLLPGSSSDGSSGGGDGVGDAYEAHQTLPMGNVAVITNCRLLMLSAPEFAVLEAEVLSGRRTHVDAVPAGRLLWQLTWDQMLCVELAYHSQQCNAAPDGVIVHRKYRSEADDVLVHDVRCNPSNNQAVWLFEAITAARHKYFLDPRREARGWRVTPVIAAEQQSNQEMPDVMPSMDFKRVWQSGPLSAAAAAAAASGGGTGARGARDTRVLSVWRPVGPPGYSSLGDVALAGSEPPSGKPVRMYKDVVGAGDSPGQVGVSKDSLPPLALPERFQIVYRDSGMSCPLSIWRPVPPKGYVELGHVVVPAIEEPPLNIVRVVRADLVAPSRLYHAPVWSGTSSDNMYWQCDVWQVDNTCSTFVAVRHDGSGSSNAAPDPSQARAPRY